MSIQKTTVYSTQLSPNENQMSDLMEKLRKLLKEINEEGSFGFVKLEDLVCHDIYEFAYLRGLVDLKKADLRKKTKELHDKAPKPKLLKKLRLC